MERSWAPKWTGSAAAGSDRRAAAFTAGRADHVPGEGHGAPDRLPADGDPDRLPDDGAPDRLPADGVPDRPAPRRGAHAAAGARLLLPVALARGRLDPSRGAATGLVLVALLAALVTGAVVLRGRPQEVVPSAVLSSGVPLPGASGPPGAARQPAVPQEGSGAAGGGSPEGRAAGGGSAGGSPAGGGSAGGAAAGGAAAGAPQVVVAVAGKVRRPGLVRRPAGSRVDDAVRAAGGVLPGAGAGLLNLARPLVDGEQVLVGVDPPPGQPPAGAAGAPAAGPATDGPLDLNTAGVGELDALPGIGPVLAQRIVDWRAEHGRFASVEQLREVTGIGESKYEDLRKRVTV